MKKRKTKKERYIPNKFTAAMQKKLVVLFLIVLLAFIGLSARLIWINKESGEKYKKQVLSQQRYDSTTIPYKRGDIVDAKGTKLAVSEKVYNVILDTDQMLSSEDNVNPTIRALVSCFGVEEGKLRSYIAENPNSKYYILAKQLTHDEISEFLALQEDTENNPNIKGVWFEEEYRRTYPNGSLASDVIGFTGKNNAGTYGLEQYYNDILNGVNGRTYGYLNENSDLERTTKAAVDGNTIVSTLDANIQSIAERCIKEFNEEYKDAVRPGYGSKSTGCIIMNPNNGEVLAMVNFPNYDLNNPMDTTKLVGLNYVAENGTISDDVITEESLETMTDEEISSNLNALWKNLCISNTYEAGSVSKPFTTAAGLESGKLTGNETYDCQGYLEVGDYKIRCHTRAGDGVLTLAEAIERSCNVALMYEGMAIGKDIFLEFQHNFNFGLKTNIDLAGESRTASLVHTEETMGPTELATCTFGQGFNVTMIQMAAAFSSLINGGYYYEPHVVSKIINSDGATVKTIEPRVLKQTISNTTSEKIVEYCNTVVTGEFGTGKKAKPAGYTVGGKTGTAEKLPRGNQKYVVSFMGYAPAEDPQVLIYIVIDEPNMVMQDLGTAYAATLAKDILTEVLPYMNIFMTEELTEEQRAELEARQIKIAEALNAGHEPVADNEEDGEMQGADGEEVTSKEGEETPEEGTLEEGTAPSESENTEEEEQEIHPPVGVYDPETGYAIDPETGEYYDPVTGEHLTGSPSFME